jgi:RNA polymerase sigma factor (sigma-70 family)
MELTPMAGRRAIRENALIDIFLAKRTRLVQMATRIIGCQCLAEDVVQETMLKICEGGPHVEVKSPTAYLFRMVRNLAIDCARRRAREQHLDAPEEGSPELMAACPCPETTMARCQALRIVMAALQELPERTRHAFELHRIEGVSQRDIASRLKVSPTLVNFMVRDAHNHCRSKLLSHEMDSEIVPPPAGRVAQDGPPSPRGATGRKGRSGVTVRRSSEPASGEQPSDETAKPEPSRLVL